MESRPAAGTAHLVDIYGHIWTEKALVYNSSRYLTSLEVEVRLNPNLGNLSSDEKIGGEAQSMLADKVGRLFRQPLLGAEI